ncbi:MAG: hypothetical protein JO323_03880 [Acidobacteriia bacterium]|nr:hypothetical protein [Terriglobia bacterium]
MADNRELENLPDLSDPGQRHEIRDINVWAIGKVGIGLILTTIASILIVLGVFRYLQLQYNATPAAGNYTGIDVDARKLPPDPRLISDEPENLQQTQAAEDQLLNGYRWSDEKHTQVAVPISRAIDMLVARGLPSAQGNAAGAPAGVAVPTESGLGPKIQPPGGPLAAELAAPAPAGEGAETKGK